MRRGTLDEGHLSLLGRPQRCGRRSPLITRSPKLQSAIVDTQNHPTPFRMQQFAVVTARLAVTAGACSVDLHGVIAVQANRLGLKRHAPPPAGQQLPAHLGPDG